MRFQSVVRCGLTDDIEAHPKQPITEREQDSLGVRERQTSESRWQNIAHVQLEEQAA
jgi:hypothetical protein